MIPPRVVAVVCTYWPNRLENVNQILRDLTNSSRPPDKIVILNNNPDRVFPQSGGVINSFNTTCRGKFVAALLDVADYYLLLDDDTSVGPKTIETLLQYATPAICTGYLGCWIDREAVGGPSVNSGARLWPHDATAITPCETFCGCAMFMSFQAIVRMLQLEIHVRLSGQWPHQGDDLLAGLANDSEVVPLHGDAKFVDLGYQGQAMCYSDEDYYGMRDRFLRDVLAVQEGIWR